MLSFFTRYLRPLQRSGAGILPVEGGVCRHLWSTSCLAASTPARYENILLCGNMLCGNNDTCRLDDLLQRMSEDLDKKSRHELLSEEADMHSHKTANPEFRPPLPTIDDVNSADRSSHEQFDRNSELWSRTSEKKRDEGPWRKHVGHAWEREERRDGDWPWGQRGGRNWDRERGRGYGQRERRGWRQDYGAQFRSRDRRGQQIVRLDASRITTEQWSTPLPRDMRKEK